MPLSSFIRLPRKFPMDHAWATARAIGMCVAINAVITACSDRAQIAGDAGDTGSPYLFVFAGDEDGKDTDFALVIDVDPASETRGTPLFSLPIGHRTSMPHHTEYTAPPEGEPIFMNAHHHELTLRINVSDLPSLTLDGTLEPPEPFRFPHDYTRTPTGTRLVGFLRSDGAGPNPDFTMTPGNHGGIAEYAADGTLLRTQSAAVDGLDKAVRPYAFALLPDIDRFVVTSAPMMEQSWADVIQIYRYSDFSLLHTIDLPAARNADGNLIEGSQAAGFGPRGLDDGSIFFNAYGCAFYHLTDIDKDAPVLTPVYAIDTPPAKSANRIRGACGIPVRHQKFWLQPVGALNAVVVLDISDPDAPRELSRLRTPRDFVPHWLSKDPLTNRFVLGAEVGDEKGFFILRFDEETGTLVYDTRFRGKDGSSFLSPNRKGYISLNRREWPHGATGNAWGHAALFME